jgi:hypothetical protein
LKAGADGWRADVTSYGVRIGLRAPSAELGALMTERLPPAWTEGRRPVTDRLYDLAAREGDRFALSADGCGLVEGTRAAALDMLAADVQAYVAEMAPDRVFVHAGVIGWKGRALVVPGRSRSGKSTLIAGLVRAGATYYSDEYAVLDERGHVHPYPRPLSLRRGGAGARQVPAQKLGGTIGVEPLRVGLVVLSEYRPGSRWRPRALSVGRAVFELIAHTVSIRRQPEAALAALRSAVDGARVLQGERGEAGAMVPELLHEEVWG